MGITVSLFQTRSPRQRYIKHLSFEPLHVSGGCWGVGIWYAKPCFSLMGKPCLSPQACGLGLIQRAATMKVI